MQLFAKHQPSLVDIDKLEQEIHGRPLDPEVDEYVRQHDPGIQAYIPPKHQDKRVYTALQYIAYEITQLTWTDAVRMGEAISTLFVKQEETTKNLTAAIQEWAKDWEDYK